MAGRGVIQKTQAKTPNPSPKPGRDHETEKQSEHGESTRENLQSPGKQGSKTEIKYRKINRNRMSQGQQAEGARTGDRKNEAGTYTELDKTN